MSVDVTTETASILKVLGEPTRWDIVRRLAVEDLCTCHLVAELDAAQPLISHHLRVLRDAGVVRSEPCGAFTYYVLDQHLLEGIAGELGDLSRRRRRRRPCT